MISDKNLPGLELDILKIEIVAANMVTTKATLCVLRIVIVW